MKTTNHLLTTLLLTMIFLYFTIAAALYSSKRYFLVSFVMSHLPIIKQKFDFAPDEVLMLSLTIIHLKIMLFDWRLLSIKPMINSKNKNKIFC